jgi:hypothetical protein
MVQNEGHLLKLGLRRGCFEGGFLEPLGQVTGLGFGILAAADFVAPESAGQKAKADGEQCCSFHADFSRVGACSWSTRWMVAREARWPLAS